MSFKLLSAAAILFAAITASAGIFAPDAVNVKNFGAVGDGKHDDTAAIQRAIDHARHSRRPLNISPIAGIKRGAGDAALPEVIFPDGTYRITDTLVGYREMYLRGLDQATIRQDDPARDILYQHECYRSGIENLGFAGGNRHLVIWTNNYDGALINLTGCRFASSRSEAINCRSFSDAQKRPVSPYQIEKRKNGAWRISGINDLSPLPQWRNSTKLIVSGSSFDKCGRVADVGTDGTVFEHCKITVSPESEGAVFRGRDRKLDFRSNQCAAPETGLKQYWFDSDLFNLTLRGNKFESAVPMCLVQQNKKPWYESVILIVENNLLTSAGCPENGVIRFNEVPNFLFFTRNRAQNNSPAPIISWTSRPTREFMENNRYFKQLSSASQYGFYIFDNSNAFIPDLPECVAPFKLEKIPSELLKKAGADLLPPAVETPQFNSTLNAVDFGLKGDGRSDDSPALKRALDAAFAKKSCAVLLPGKIIRLAAPVVLPPETILIGNGGTFIIGSNGAEDWEEIPNDGLTGNGTTRVYIKNVAFRSFGSAINLKASSSGKINLAGCRFYKCSAPAVKVMADDSPNKLVFSIANGQFFARTAVETNADCTRLANLWFAGDWLADNQAYFINHGGTMFVESVVGVPQALKGQERTKLDSTEKIVWPWGGNMRWFDNGGRLIIRDMRFGGEGGGPTLIFTTSPQATIFLEGGFATTDNAHARNCYFFFQSPPTAVVAAATGNIPGLRSRRIWLGESPLPGTLHFTGVGAGLDVKTDPDGIPNAFYK